MTVEHFYDLTNALLDEVAAAGLDRELEPDDVRRFGLGMLQIFDLACRPAGEARDPSPIERRLAARALELRGARKPAAT